MRTSSLLLSVAFTTAGCLPTASDAVPTEPASNAVLLGGPLPVPTGAPPSRIRVNQVGYFVKQAKVASVVSPRTQPLRAELLDAGGAVVWAGETRVLGTDKDSGDSLHRVDFSTFATPGAGYRLRADDETGPSFAVGTDLYAQLRNDALWYFYHNRSGIEIALPHAGRAQWVRPAGHASDRSVPCANDAGCDYSLDVSGGWYDAGDHGKYVVNGGISVWTLLHQWERAKHLAPAQVAALGDGTLRIPERANGTPDLLDEARWELEWMLKMQVPAGKPRAGMAHHKVHDEQWTSLGTRPPTDVAELKVKRSLRPVSTAATLNLAAVAAQAARVYRELDAEFATRCREAAERAWQAALTHPNLLASPDDKQGGGPYDDRRVSDERYWAAAELYLTTQKSEYHEALTGSEWAFAVPEGSDERGRGPVSAMTWQSVAALGTISLAVVPGAPGPEVARARAAVQRRADQYLELAAQQGYRLPFAATEGGYPWGSTSYVLNNALVLALAHDFTHEPRYLAGVVAALDYVLGHNALGTSYVTGFGARAVANPHHRFWSHQLNPQVFPPPPPGAVSGGPNSGLQDPIVQAAGLKGCAPQRCYLDHVEAWSVNEITINWNAPLAWVAAYLDAEAR